MVMYGDVSVDLKEHVACVEIHRPPHNFFDQQLVKDLAMQVAAANPSYVSRDAVPTEVLEKEREIYRQQMADQKKPPQVMDKIIEGKLDKFYSEMCLLDQPFIKDASGKSKVKELVDQATAKLQERVVVRRFARFQVGEG